MTEENGELIAGLLQRLVDRNILTSEDVGMIVARGEDQPEDIGNLSPPSSAAAIADLTAFHHEGVVYVRGTTAEGAVLSLSIPAENKFRRGDTATEASMQLARQLLRRIADGVEQQSPTPGRLETVGQR